MRRSSEIQAAHKQRMGELVALLAADPQSGFAVQARKLLTASWVRASWRAREDILVAVDWLLGLERQRQSSMPNVDLKAGAG